ncbi:MAG: NAD(P)-binding protein [Acidobacteria bacterium]|nr:NAD(P)-binding protein [Acidobacteriota bacterium]
MRRIIVIDGGLAGLTAAVRLAGKTEVIAIDSRPRLGGQILTERHGALTIVRGAERFVFRSEAVPRLAADVRIGDDVIGQSAMLSYGFDGEALRVLAPGQAAAFQAFQVAPSDLGQGIRSFRHGMGSLVSALQAHLHGRVDVRTGTTASRVELREPGGCRVLVGDDAIDVHGVVVATDARSAASLLASVEPSAAGLATAHTLSSSP